MTFHPEPRAVRLMRRPAKGNVPAMLQGEGYPAVVLETYCEPPLPKAKPGVWLLVSRAVFEMCPDRRDLICPAGVLRQSDGALACRAFRRRP